MSTNIRIDVTLQKLQEVANKTTEKNREEKKAREDDLAVEAKAAELSGERDGSVPPLGDLVDSLGQPLSRTGEPPSEKQKPNQADKSSVPNTYKKLDVGAGAISLGFEPVHGWRQTRTVFNNLDTFFTTEVRTTRIYSADGSAFGETTFETLFDNGPEYDSTTAFELSNSETTYRRFWSILPIDATLVLPVDKNSLIFVQYNKNRYRGVNYEIPTDEWGKVPPEGFGVIDFKTEQADCFLVGKDFVRKLDTPSEFLNKLNTICPDHILWPIESETEPSVSYFDPIYYQLVPSGEGGIGDEEYSFFTDPDGAGFVSFPGGGDPSPAVFAGDRINLTEYLERFFGFGRQQDRTVENFDALYSHYIRGSNFDSGFFRGPTLTSSPAVFYWLNDYDYEGLADSIGGNFDPVDNRFYTSYEQIRNEFSANYGRSQGNTFYGLTRSLTEDGAAVVKWYKMPPIDEPISSFSANDFDIEFPDGSVKEIKRFGKFTGVNFKPSGAFTTPANSDVIAAWDGNVSGYCREQLLLLGFKPGDLQPG